MLRQAGLVQPLVRRSLTSSTVCLFLITHALSSNFLQLRRSLVTGKDIKYGNDCRALLLQGVEKLAQAVETTLGPKVSSRPTLLTTLLASLFPSAYTNCMCREETWYLTIHTNPRSRKTVSRWRKLSSLRIATSI